MFSISPAQMAKTRQAPTDFKDGFIRKRSQGKATVHFLDGSVISFRIYESPADFHTLPVGEPVAYHETAEVLAIYNYWIAVKVIVDS